MTLYDIDTQIENLIDPESGEIVDMEAFEGLQMAREAKLENIALYIKDLKAEAEALKNEEATLTERRRAAERKAESLRNFLSRVLDGQPFKTSRCACAFRRSSSVELDDGFLDWARIFADDVLVYKDPVPDKAKIKSAMKEGRELVGAHIVEKVSLNVR